MDAHTEVTMRRFPALTTPHTPHFTFTFTELVSFTFPPRFPPQGRLRHISSRSLSVCFGLLSTSGQHLTSEQITIQDPESAEADAGT